jgi:nucleoside-diphosphate kinase
MDKERTFVLIKPDGVKKALIGKIIQRFEDSALKLIALKMLWVDEKHAKQHYKLDEEWAKKVYEKTLSAYQKEGKKLEFKSHMDLGLEIQKRNIDFITEGPVIALVLEGNHAIEIVRKMVGHTEPRQALPGTIRGDFASLESYADSDEKKQAVRNLIHASDSTSNATHEIALWFTPKEIHNFKTIHDFIS